ncbi:MAG: hypothetical protein FJX51_11270 [Alphaproteobacteria bacterium]|nr:hypothetical protein [Alphaproteobacteria bacterium]
MTALRSLSEPGTGSARALWLAALVMPGVAASLVFACTAPFAAVAAWAALTLSTRDGRMAAAALWAGNQAVGFAVLGYGFRTEALSWSVAMLAAAILAFEAARLVSAAAGGTTARVAAAVGMALVTHQAAMWLATFPLGNTDGSSLAIVGDVAVFNLVWAAGLGLAFAALAGRMRAALAPSR